jgi:hypothetical protein
LGTYTGASYSAFCQATERCHLACACVAVDTWEGDDQTGHYSEQVFQDFKKFHDDRYSAFSILLRERFDMAVEKFKDRSIDILHIDGFHQYEAVKLDFETWLPKLSNCGVILFHDSNERTGDFGVWRLIDQLRERFPVFEFLHGHGLAVVAVGEQIPVPVKELCELTSPSNIATVRDRFAFAGSRWISDMEQARYAMEQARFAKEVEAAAVQVASLEANVDCANAVAKDLHEQLEKAQDAYSAAREEFAIELERQRAGKIQAETQAEGDRQRAAEDAEARKASYQLLSFRYEKVHARSEELKRAHEAACLENSRLTTNLNLANRSISDLSQQLSRTRGSDSWVLMNRLESAAGKWPLLGSLARRTMRALFRNQAVRHQEQVLRASGLFDNAWYLDQYPDVAAAGIEPLAHYLANGSNESRLPNALFDTAWYRLNNPDALAASNLYPLTHYYEFGSAEGRRPTPLFDPRWYRLQYPDVANSGMEALAHYLVSGSKELRRPSALFDPKWYLAQYPDVAAAGMDPLQHYIHHGAAENRMPNPLFKPDWYRAQYPDVAESGFEPLGHYTVWGAKEGRRPCASFDPHWYQSAFRDVQSSGMEPFAHYLLFGKEERRQPAQDWES